MMRLCWLNSTFNEVKLMKSWIDHHCRMIQKAPTPKLLPHEQLLGLIENFKYFDADQSGTVSCQELIASGLLDREDQVFKNTHFSFNEELSLEDFCAMFAPAGYRATEHSTTATDEAGNPLVYEQGYGWRYTDEQEISENKRKRERGVVGHQALSSTGASELSKFDSYLSTHLKSDKKVDEDYLNLKKQWEQLEQRVKNIDNSPKNKDSSGNNIESSKGRRGSTDNNLNNTKEVPIEQNAGVAAALEALLKVSESENEGNANDADNVGKTSSTVSIMKTSSAGGKSKKHIGNKPVFFIDQKQRIERNNARKKGEGVSFMKGILTTSAVEEKGEM